MFPSATSPMLPAGAVAGLPGDWHSEGFCISPGLSSSAVKRSSSLSPLLAESPTFSTPEPAPGAACLLPGPDPYSKRLSFQCSSELPSCLPVFLVSLASPSAVTSTKELIRDWRPCALGFADTTRERGEKERLMALDGRWPDPSRGQCPSKPRWPDRHSSFQPTSLIRAAGPEGFSFPQRTPGHADDR